MTHRAAVAASQLYSSECDAPLSDRGGYVLPGWLSVTVYYCPRCRMALHRGNGQIRIVELIEPARKESVPQ